MIGQPLGPRNGLGQIGVNGVDRHRADGRKTGRRKDSHRTPHGNPETADRKGPRFRSLGQIRQRRFDVQNLSASERDLGTIGIAVRAEIQKEQMENADPMERSGQIEKVRLAGAVPMQEQKDPLRMGMRNPPRREGETVGGIQPDRLPRQAEIFRRAGQEATGGPNHFPGTQSTPPEAENEESQNNQLDGKG